MRPGRLMLDDIPPFSVPLRFYLTAPWFGMLAGLAWLRDGEWALASRWLPGTLAATHLLALGFMASVMVGSLFQVLPVLGGRSVPGARRAAPAIHVVLTCGALALAIGLDTGSAAWLTVAFLALLGAFVVFVPLLAVRLLDRSARGDALSTIRLAVLALAVTVGLGLFMAAGHAWPGLGINYRAWTDAHARFGLGGFTLLLVMGVSHQVVPMFHVTPGFPARLLTWTGRGVFGGILLLAVTSARAVVVPAVTLVAASGLCYAGAGLWQLARRRRRRAEPLVRAWQAAFGCLALVLLLGWLHSVLPAVQVPGVPPQRLELLIVLLFGFGFAITVILGMLGKIVPFLAFTHLQRRCLRHPAAVPLLPTMDRIVSDRAAWTQLGVHAATVVVVCAAALVPQLARLAGVLLIADFAICARNVSAGAARYRQAARAIDAAIASAP